MPLHVDIRVNDQHLASLTIGRTEEFKGQHHEHEYMVVRNQDFTSMARFTHTYSDGAEVCVERALQALRSA